eukprot:763069-Hanusia_phi.AAC.1
MARDWGTSILQLWGGNQLFSPSYLESQQSILVGPIYTVGPDETLPEIALKFGRSALDVLDWNPDIPMDPSIINGQLPLLSSQGLYTLGTGIAPPAPPLVFSLLALQTRSCLFPPPPLLSSPLLSSPLLSSPLLSSPLLSSPLLSSPLLSSPLLLPDTPRSHLRIPVILVLFCMLAAYLTNLIMAAPWYNQNGTILTNSQEVCVLPDVCTDVKVGGRRGRQQGH